MIWLQELIKTKFVKNFQHFLKYVAMFHHWTWIIKSMLTNFSTFFLNKFTTKYTFTYYYSLLCSNSFKKRTIGKNKGVLLKRTTRYYFVGYYHFLHHLKAVTISLYVFSMFYMYFFKKINFCSYFQFIVILSISANEIISSEIFF